MALAVATSVMLTTNALAKTAWLAHEDLPNNGENASLPQVAIDERGDAVAVWRAKNGGNSFIRASTRPAGGSWGSPVFLFDPANGDNAYDPQLAVNESGNAVAVWRRSAAGQDKIQAATRSAGGSWNKTVDLFSAQIGSDAYMPQVAVDALGNAVAIWAQVDSFGNHVIVARKLPVGEEEWNEPALVSESSGTAKEDPRVAIDPSGNALAVWQGHGGVIDHTVIKAAALAAGSKSWSAPEMVTSEGWDEDASDPQIAIDANGNAEAVWESHVAGDAWNPETWSIKAAARPAGGEWSDPPTDLTWPSKYNKAYDPQVAVDPRGDAVVVWQWFDGNKFTIAAKTRLPNSLWSSLTTISGSDVNNYDPQVALDASGNAVAVWERGANADAVIQGATRPANGEWSKTDISDYEDKGFMPQVAADPNGNAVAVWRSRDDQDNENWVIQAAGYDGAPPLLNSLDIPGEGTLGTPLSFSVSPLDVWSPTSVTWDFGDVESATGSSVSHIYKAVGTHTVEVTATDAFGHAASATRELAVTEPAAGATTNGSAQLDITAPTVKVRKPKNRKRYRRRGLRRLVGTATDASGVSKVEYALARKRAKARRRTRRYVVTSGKERWQVKLKRRLPKGAYALYVRATDNRGNVSKPVRVNFRIV